MDLYFERSPFENHISRTEWLDAIASTPSVRLAEGRSPSDYFEYVEVYFPILKQWQRAFRFRSLGDAAAIVVVFPDPEEFGRNWKAEPGTEDWRNDPVHVASIALSKKLSAKLVSEDDTKYEN